MIRFSNSPGQERKVRRADGGRNLRVDAGFEYRMG
jgi:hypothetical protein